MRLVIKNPKDKDVDEPTLELSLKKVRWKRYGLVSSEETVVLQGKDQDGTARVLATIFEDPPEIKLWRGSARKLGLKCMEGHDGDHQMRW
jgi:hypothetical protein